MKKFKTRRLIGLCGLFGLLGLRYFATGNPADLFWFSSFGFFAFFILGDLNYEFPDERWQQNANRAANVTLSIAVIFIFIIGFAASTLLASREIVTFLAVLGWISSLFSYAIAFRFLETR